MSFGADLANTDTGSVVVAGSVFPLQEVPVSLASGKLPPSESHLHCFAVVELYLAIVGGYVVCLIE
jgi:hypothetical protein